MRARLTGACALAGSALGAAGCGEQSPLDPRSDPARDIATLWWWMLAIASVVFIGAVVLLVVAWLRREREGLPWVGGTSRLTTGLVVAFGMVIPLIVLVGVFVFGNFVVLPVTDAPRASTTAMTIQITARQWFWEVRYPGTGAITANEIHIPARTRVNVALRSSDVIHSFWVPKLNRKVDAVPGHPNRMLLYAERPGRYRGQCAELCGLQHSHMSNYVVAEPPEHFRAWLENAARPRPEPATAIERRGERTFLASACASCHTIRGTAARGRVGPDLTHVGSRSTLAALTIPNTRAQLRRWIRNPQAVKPGNRMPALGLSSRDIDALSAYLESLR